MENNRIENLKQLSSIRDDSDVEYKDLFLKDETGKYFYEYIVEKPIYIYKKSLLKEISNNYDLLLYFTNNKFILDKYDNVDLLFDTSHGKSLIELMYEKKAHSFSYLSPDILYRLFEKQDGQYMIQKLIEIDKNNNKNVLYSSSNSSSISNFIKKLNDSQVLYNCLKEINAFYLMSYCNERCLLSKGKDGLTILEELIQNRVNVSVNSDFKCEDTAQILYDNQIYTELLQLDCNILYNYPTRENNYINMLIDKCKSTGEDYFDYIYFSSSNNEILANIYMLLIKNNIKFLKPTYFNLVDIFDNDNNLPLIFHMLKIDKELALEYFVDENVESYIFKFLKSNLSLTEEDLENIDINNVVNYLPDPSKLLKELKSGEKKSIEKSDILREDIIKPLEDGISILEYALKNKINTYIYKLENMDEVAIFLKYNSFFTFSEYLLYQKFNDNKLLIEFLMENKKYSLIKLSSNSDLRIIEYCIKYNNFEALNNQILEEMFASCNGKMLAEKLLNNDKFLDTITQTYDLGSKAIKLYEKGYKKIMINAKEEDLLKPYNGKTILDDLLDSNLDPTFYNYDFASLETMDILKKHHRYDLFYNAKLELLMNYPNLEYNYMQYLIDCCKSGINVNLEKSHYNSEDKELLAKCYIQMAKNSLVGYMNDLTEKNILKPGRDDKHLLYYLIKLDKDLTINTILPFDLKKNPLISSELKILGVSENLLLTSIEYDKFDCNSVCIDLYNSQYDEEIKSPVEDLLEELRDLFQKDGKSDMKIVEALIKSYRYTTSINPIFIKELKQIIELKINRPTFYYIREKNSGYFRESDESVFVENEVISTLNHETGHALHYFLTDFATPDDYNEVLNKILHNQDSLRKIDNYSKLYHQILEEMEERAKLIVSKNITSDNLEEDIDDFLALLSTEREKFEQKYLEKGYSKETLDIILDNVFTKEEFLKQKTEIEEREVSDIIMRYDYDAFISIGDIIDAITSGKFKGNVLKNDENQVISSAYGHGIRYYSRNDDSESLHFKFTEMIANYSAIIKSKNSEKIIVLLRDIVGDELVDMLDDFYKNNMLKLDASKKLK